MLAYTHDTGTPTAVRAYSGQHAHSMAGWGGEMGGPRLSIKRRRQSQLVLLGLPFTSRSKSPGPGLMERDGESQLAKALGCVHRGGWLHIGGCDGGLLGSIGACTRARPYQYSQSLIPFLAFSSSLCILLSIRNTAMTMASNDKPANSAARS